MNRLLVVLATAFVEQLEAVTRAGLVAGYGEASAVSCMRADTSPS